ncbi:MAG: tyrosine-type recombinase/integrase [Methanomassiliicoccales archaeon]|nr:MAG: tyrosine-type recombinase/integrase [Methanomassiliicoccales archaeon]
MPEILFNEERLKYLDTVDSFEDLIFARLGMYSGLRLNEALNITPNDIVFPERAVSVIGKGNKQRYVPVDHATLQILQCYLNDRDLGFNDKIFTVTSRTIQNRVSAIAEKAGINRIQVTPHTLRHTACSLMLYRKIPVEIVQKIMGHADISTTMIYYHTVPNIVVRSYYEAFGEGLL